MSCLIRGDRSTKCLREPGSSQTVSRYALENKRRPAIIDRHMNERAIVTDLREAILQAAKTARDPEAMRKSRRRMDENREALRAKHGEVDVAVGLIREVRGEAE